MRVLLTGASSFTGSWFANALADGGHTVLAPLRGSRESGGDVDRANRLERIAHKVEIVEECPFGSPSFLDVVGSRDFDILCHHAAEVGDYRSPDYDVASAVARNTHNLRSVLHLMSKRGLRGLVLTGTFFEFDEGSGNPPLTAFNLYGLAKGLTSQAVGHYCHEAEIPFAKFVIPHPFGPYEQPRLGAYLAKTWRSGQTAEIKTPSYVRDNIHVSLLAACYARFVEEAASNTNGLRSRKLNPSGYVESQGAFVERVAREIGKRTGRDCRVRLLRQETFTEPFMRVNTDPAALYAPTWNEAAAWDAYAEAFA